MSDCVPSNSSFFLRAQANFLNQINLILPCPASAGKIFRFRQTQITPTTPAIRPRRGALAIVTNVGAGCGGRGSVRRESVRRAVIRERARRADERRFNAFARASVGRHSAGWSFWRRKLRTAKPCGPGTRGWCQAGGGLQAPNRAMRTVNSSAMEARGIRLQGELGISRKTIAQGMPGCSGCTCMLVCAFLSASCTRDRGC